MEKELDTAESILIEEEGKEVEDEDEKEKEVEEKEEDILVEKKHQ